MTFWKIYVASRSDYGKNLGAFFFQSCGGPDTTGPVFACTALGSAAASGGLADARPRRCMGIVLVPRNGAGAWGLALPTVSKPKEVAIVIYWEAVFLSTA